MYLAWHGTLVIDADRQPRLSSSPSARPAPASQGRVEDSRRFLRREGGWAFGPQQIRGLNPLRWLREVESPQFGVLSARAPPSPRCTALTAASCENHGAAPNFGTRVPGIFGGKQKSRKIQKTKKRTCRHFPVPYDSNVRMKRTLALMAIAIFRMRACLPPLSRSSRNVHAYYTARVHAACYTAACTSSPASSATTLR